MHLGPRVLRADQDVDGAGPRDAPHELAQVGAVLERREDLAELVAVGELRGLHDVQEAVAEDLLDRGGVVFVEDAHDPLADAPREALDRVVLGQSGEDRRRAAARRVGQPLVEQTGDAVEGRLIDRFGLVQAHDRLLDAALAEHEDQARHPLVDRDQVDAPDVRGARLGRGGQAGGARQAGERRRREAEPVLTRELDLAELVADHQLLDRRQRYGVDDRLHVEAVAGVRGHAPGTCVRVGQQPGGFELREDASNGRTGHAEAIALDERLAADRLCGRDVFLDDGPKDRLRAEVQGAEWSTVSTRQARSPADVSTR